MNFDPDTSDLSARLRQAIACHRSGQSGEAERLYSQILKIRPDYFDAQYMLGMLRGQQGRHQDALDLLNAALQTRPDSADAWSMHGLVLYKGGREQEALASFAHALALQPDHVGALSNRGNTLYVLKRYDEALVSYDEALRIRPDFADALNNRANILRELGRNEEAVASYDRLLAVRPGLAEAHFNRGNVLEGLGRHDDAIASYRKALAINPRYAAAHLNLGNALKGQDKLESAADHFRYAIDSEPGFAWAHNNLASTLAAQGKLDEAVPHYRRAVQLQPGFVEALSNLAVALMAQGHSGLALDALTQALAAKETAEAKTLFVECIKDIEPEGNVGELRRLVERALAEGWARPGMLAAVGARLVQCDDTVRTAVSRAVQAWPRRELLGQTGLRVIANDTLLQRLLVSAPVRDVALERFLTMLRPAILASAAEDAAAGSRAAADDALTLGCCLAQQCFINEYAFAVGDDEDAKARALQQALVTALERGDDVPPLWLAAVAAYVPLHSLHGAERLTARGWPRPVADLLRQQIAQPREEEALRPTIAQLTPIDDAVSAAVRQQYEENPYPRWVSVPAGEATTIVDHLRHRFPLASIDDPAPARKLDILIAGCGTGQQSIETARRFPDANVLALDLSLQSLCYAKRKTRELGLTNIDYAQADILNLPAVDRMFDVVESSGVLHHLADPMRGWRALLARLRPGGFMRIGLYSELARRDIVAARALIAERGYQPTADGIRRFRQELMELPATSPLKSLVTAGDFFTTSGCRDLLFHVQECRLTLPQIGAFLMENGLVFLGFEIDAQTQHRYRTRFPGDRSMSDLVHWHAFEAENPSTFQAMYQFWVRNGRGSREPGAYS